MAPLPSDRRVELRAARCKQRHHGVEEPPHRTKELRQRADPRVAKRAAPALFQFYQGRILRLKYCRKALDQLKEITPRSVLIFVLFFKPLAILFFQNVAQFRQISEKEAAMIRLSSSMFYGFCRNFAACTDKCFLSRRIRTSALSNAARDSCSEA